MRQLSSTRKVSQPFSEAYLVPVLRLRTQLHCCTCERQVNLNYHHPWSKKSTMDCLGSAHGSNQSRHLAERSIFGIAWGSSLVLRDAHQVREELQIAAETHPVPKLFP